jgi:hypothetical protein
MTITDDERRWFHEHPGREPVTGPHGGVTLVTACPRVSFVTCDRNATITGKGAQTMTVTDDERAWFARNPTRSYRCRLSTPAEIDALRDMGWFDNGRRLAEGCFLHCLSRIDRTHGDVEAMLVVLPPGERDEAASREAWFAAEQGERAKQ